MSKTFGARSTCDEVVAGLDLSGRNILVTGANAGIGYETARSLASRNAHVLIACRDESKTAEVARRIREAHPQAQLSELVVDLASFASVRRAAAKVGAVDTLIFNAGLFTPNFALTEDGLESTVGVCHFGHFLLFSLLREKLQGDARVVAVASESHRYPATLDLARFPLDASNYRGLIAYGQAKLSNVLFANEIARRYPNIRANSLHPGALIGTSIFRSSVAAKALALVVRPFTKTVAQGAATTVYCATAPGLPSGRYFADCREKPMSQGARDLEIAAKLWELSERRVA